jgi:hypothetical protein
VKAVAGGGDTGMHRADERDGLVDGVRTAQREAGSAFCSATVHFDGAEAFDERAGAALGQCQAGGRASVIRRIRSRISSLG